MSPPRNCIHNDSPKSEIIVIKNNEKISINACNSCTSELESFQSIQVVNS